MTNEEMKAVLVVTGVGCLVAAAGMALAAPAVGGAGYSALNN